VLSSRASTATEQWRLKRNRRSQSSRKSPHEYSGEARKQIFVADVASGQVYQYSISSKTSKVLVSGLNAPTAQAFDAQSNRLFVADPGRGESSS